MHRLFGVIPALVLWLAPSPAGVGAQQLGVYRWEAPAAPAKVDAFEVWLGRPVPLAQAFEARDIWDNIDGAAWQLGPWSQWIRAKPGRNIVLGVPMMPGEPDGSGPDRIPGTADDVSLEKCAAGQYDVYWRNLANELAVYALHWAYLRLGWEMDGDWYAWGAPQGSGKEASFAGCFRRIVQVMRATQPANQWKFVWNPTATWTDPAYLTATWPGDAYVDVVGIDLYDHSWAPNTYPYPSVCDSACRLARQQTAWNGYAWYLDTVRSFAVARRKAFAIPEWGLYTRTDNHGGGDNAYYIRKMHEYISKPDNAVLFHVYFDVNSPDGDHHISGLDQPTTFPQSAATFRQLFGPATTTSTPTTTATTLPAPTSGTTEIWWKSPVRGATVSGVLQLGQCFVAGRGVARVEFFLGTTRLNTDSNVADGMSCVLDTRKFPNGTRELRAVAYGPSGTTYRASNSIIINNPAPGALPAPTSGTTEIWWKSPVRGATVSGVLQLGSCYVGGIGVARVEFFLDSTRLNTDSAVADGMSCVLDTRRFTNGTHQLKATAYGPTGAVYNHAISLTIKN